MAVKVVWSSNSLLEADTITPLAFTEALITNGALSSTTSTSFTMAIVTPEGSLIGDVTGTGFSYITVNGSERLVGGALEAMDISAFLPSTGSFDIASFTNIDLDAADIASAIQADIDGSDDTAVEDVLLGLDWNFTLNDSNSDAGMSFFFGDGEVGFNLKGNDKIVALGGKDEIFAGDGNDTVLGGNGQDTLYGGKGKDVLKGGKGADTLYGNGGNDTLNGGKGNDFLDGGNGNDKLFNSLGSDYFEGGSGSDVIIFNKTSELVNTGDDNIIGHFISGDDIIDLSGIDANSTKSGNQVFRFIGSNDFSERTRDLRVEELETGEYSVQGDVDGDGVADFDIFVQSDIGLTSSDFIL